MLGMLIQYALAGACLLFVVSLPIWKLPIAATMRRAAGALFLAALLPSLFFGLLSSPAPSSSAAGPSTPAPHVGVADSLSAIGGLVILCVLSYAVLEIRKRMKKTSKDAWSEYVSLRSSGKKPVSDPHSSPAPSLFDEEP